MSRYRVLFCDYCKRAHGFDWICGYSGNGISLSLYQSDDPGARKTCRKSRMDGEVAGNPEKAYEAFSKFGDEAFSKFGED